MILLAMSFGLIVIVLLSTVGESSKGPFEDLLNSISSSISRLESNIVLNNRSKRRSDRLNWLESDALVKGDSTYLNEKILLGAYDNAIHTSLLSILELESELETTFPVISIYSAWGDATHHQFPRAHVQGIIDLGSIPLITWEPWLTTFNEIKDPKIRAKEDKDKDGMVDIASGYYDFYIDRWAKEAKSFDTPIFIRFGHEMNDSYRYPWGPQNNDPTDFIAAWQYIVNRFDSLGVDNIIWVWSPHPAYRLFRSYYPGDEYVDWIGIGTLNYGTVAAWSEWWTFDEIFGNFYEELSSFNKPIMLTEFACLPVGGERSNWYREALCSLPENYPQVRGLIFFHNSYDKTTTYKALDWYLVNDTMSINVIVHCIRSWEVQGE